MQLKIKSKLLIIIIFLTTSEISGQNRISIGIGGGPDLNFYKYSNFKYKDNERSDRISLGFSTGIIMNYKLSKKKDLYSNVVFSMKNYAPDRLFNFGVIRTVNMKTIDIPLNIKYTLKELNGWMKNIYLLGGLTYQIEVYKNAKYDWFNGYDESYNFIKKNNYLFPNIGIGTEKELNKKTFLRIQLNSRFLKCHCEYLNPTIDKIGIEILLMKNL